MMQAAGQQTQFMVIARDALGTQKSLGGDTFAVSWCHTATGACTTGQCRLDNLAVHHSCAAQCLDLSQQHDKSDLACQPAYAAHHVAQPAGTCCASGPTGQSRHVVLSACEAV